MIKLNLGTILITKDEWKEYRKHFTREEIKQIIIGNGESSLADTVYDLKNDEEKQADNDWRHKQGD